MSSTNLAVPRYPAALTVSGIAPSAGVGTAWTSRLQTAKFHFSLPEVTFIKL